MMIQDILEVWKEVEEGMKGENIDVVKENKIKQTRQWNMGLV